MDIEIYRHLTGQWSHGTYQHMVVNYVGLVLVGIIFAKVVSTLSWLSWIVIISAAVSILLYIYDPELDRYVGFSGALYGLLVACLIRSIQTMPWLGIVGLIAVAIRMYIEQTGVFDVNMSPEFIGGDVWVNAHLYGAYVGAAVGFVGLMYDYLFDDGI